jgi:hypothetical protein
MVRNSKIGERNELQKVRRCVPPVTSTASDDSNDDIHAERGGRRMSRSGLLVEGEDIGGGVSWSTIIMGEIIFL